MRHYGLRLTPLSARLDFRIVRGHKTRAVFDRYNIVNEQELLTAGQRLAAYLAAERPTPVHGAA